MKIASLGSGSKGNATLIVNLDTILLIDCGFSLKKIETKAEKFGLNLSQISAIFVTHEHGDHISGVAKLASKYQIPVYVTLGSAQKLLENIDKNLIHYIHGDERINVGDIDVLAITVPHDSAEPVQFVFSCIKTSKKLGVLTDSGHVSKHMINAYSGLDGLLLEFNYDHDMLNNGPYPVSLKQRVSSDYGHLSNQQSMSLLKTIDSRKMKKLIIGHISEKNNDPAIIEALFQQEPTLPLPLLATQAEGFSWVQI